MEYLVHVLDLTVCTSKNKQGLFGKRGLTKRERNSCTCSLHLGTAHSLVIGQREVSFIVLGVIVGMLVMQKIDDKSFVASSTCWEPEKIKAFSHGRKNT